MVYADRFEIPEIGLNVDYRAVADITGGSAEELGDPEIKAEGKARIILVKFRDREGVRRLTLSWTGKGLDSVDYCEIMLYRAFAAHKVRSKNKGAPSYGIVGY